MSADACLFINSAVSCVVEGISSVEMYIADRNAEWLGVPRLVLMENAGAAVARDVVRRFPDAVNVLVVCGTGTTAETATWRRGTSTRRGVG